MWPVAATKSLSIAGLGGTVTYTISGAVTNGGTMFAQIDTLGFDSATIDLELSGANTTSNAPSLITLGESDATQSVGATSISDVQTFHGVTATATNAGWLIPVTGVNTGTVNQVYRFNVDTRARKRYLFLTCNPVTTMYGIVHVSLGKPEQMPINATAMGVAAEVDG